MFTRFGDSVVVAIDHGLHWGVFEGFEDPEETLELVLESGPDGILASVPFLRRFEETINDYDVATIATLDLLHDSTLPGDHEDQEIHRQVFSVDAAAELGADAMKVALVYGREDVGVLEENVQFVADAAERGEELGIPLVVEPTLWGQRADDELDPSYLADANRIAFELGAHILKSPYPGEGAFDPIVENAPLPVYIAGGPPVETDVEVLEMVRGAVDAGSCGVMFGRNVWQRDDPSAIIDALKAIVHDDATVDDAATHLTE
ncbi:class I fructose-bisphosphate aldolase [Halobellus marinus]|uniref:class I fructose-bisphosphate aldolase n=1 Tax=Halobellus TaxID=1073986 RepID=UPI0028ACFA61|nr:fructose-1,6-bisphosphate aldolase [Halobellus sp. DFY28]